jgi:carbamoyl-phosphate synthase small subunit
VQYHPEAAPGPNDAAYFFGEFAALIEKTKEV